MGRLALVTTSSFSAVALHMPFRLRPILLFLSLVNLGWTGHVFAQKPVTQAVATVRADILAAADQAGQLCKAVHVAHGERPNDASVETAVLEARADTVRVLVLARAAESNGYPLDPETGQRWYVRLCFGGRTVLDTDKLSGDEAIYRKFAAFLRSKLAAEASVQQWSSVTLPTLRVPDVSSRGILMGEVMENCKKEWALTCRVEASQLFIPVAPKASAEEAEGVRARIAFLRQEVVAGRLTFNQAALQCGGKTATTSGRLPPFGRDEVPAEIFNAAMWLDRGGITLPIRSNVGWHVLVRTGGDSYVPPPVQELDTAILKLWTDRERRRELDELLGIWAAKLKVADLLKGTSVPEGSR